MRLHELTSEPLVIRACASTYVVFGLIFGVTLVPGLALIPKRPPRLIGRGCFEFFGSSTQFRLDRVFQTCSSEQVHLISDIIYWYPVLRVVGNREM